MSKELEEIIEHLKCTVSSMRASGSSANTEHVNRIVQQIGRLSELAKSVQYVVEIKKDGNYYQAHIEGRILCALIYWTNNNDSDLASIKGMVPECLNKLRSILSLPPITIEQITFTQI